MKVSARLLVKLAVKYGHDVSIIDTSANESYLLAHNPAYTCPTRYLVITSFKVSHRYARLARNRAYNQMFRGPV